MPVCNIAPFDIVATLHPLPWVLWTTLTAIRLGAIRKQRAPHTAPDGYRRCGGPPTEQSHCGHGIRERIARRSTLGWRPRKHVCIARTDQVRRVDKPVGGHVGVEVPVCHGRACPKVTRKDGALVGPRQRRVSMCPCCCQGQVHGRTQAQVHESDRCTELSVRVWPVGRRTRRATGAEMVHCDVTWQCRRLPGGWRMCRLPAS